MLKKILFAALVFGPSICAAGSAATTNYYYYWVDYSLPGYNRMNYQLACPGDYPRLVSGSCGHRDSNSAQTDIQVNYAGSLPGAETAGSRCLANNTSGASRAIRIGIVCGK
jgi:hypothetical protein